MSSIFYLCRQSWNSLKRTPNFVAAVTVTMGFVLGTLACVLTLAYLLLVEPLPYPEQEKLVRIEHALLNENGVNNLTAFTYPGLIHLYKNQQVFEQAAIINYESDILTSLPHQPNVKTSYVTPEWFSLLNAPFILGRGFEQSEAINTQNPVAVISYKTWRDEFNFDKNILAKKVTLKGISFRIIGVLDEKFVEPKIQNTSITTSIWLPWDFNQHSVLANNWGHIRPSLVFIGKLKNNWSISRAEQSLTSLVNGIWRENVADIHFFKGWNIEVHIRSFQSVILGESKKTVYLLLAGVLGLMIISCTNLANLFISRAVQQQHHLAIHAAIGAKPWHIFRYFLLETSLLMLMSLAIAVVTAIAGFTIIENYFSTMLPRTEELKLNHVTISAALLIASLCASLFAYASSKMVNYSCLNHLLQSGSKGVGAQISKLIRSFFIAIQIAMATAIVFVNVSLFKLTIDTVKQPLGFDLQDISQLIITDTQPFKRPDQESQSLMREITNQLLLLPVVKSISQSSSPLIKASEAAFTNVDTNERFVNENRWVDDKYFHMIAQPLVAGGYFDATDVREQSKVLIINEVFAKQLVPNGNAVGIKLANPGGTIFTVKGIVKGIKRPGEKQVSMRSYRAISSPSNSLLIQTHKEQTLTREQVISVIRKVSSAWALSNLESLQETHQRLLFTPVITVMVTSALAVLAISMSGIGLYGILSYSIKIRRFELATRMAVGAKKRDILMLIINSNLKSILLGISASVAMLMALYMAYRDNLIEYFNGQLIPVVILTLTLIFLTSLIACYLPLRKYINTPPINSLRGI